MATLTYIDGHVIDLIGTTAFEIRIHPGDSTAFHIHAKGSNIREAIWKQKHLEIVARDRNDFAQYVLDEGKNVKIDKETNRVVPNE